jgi:hypothetical protein
MPLAIVGAAGNAILFVVTLLGVTILTLYVMAYAARCLLVVVQGTAIGEDEVTWPDEPLYDWLLGSVHLAFLLLLWLLPIGLVARNLGPVSWLPDEFSLRFLILAAPGLWLLFPIGLLSSLSATSRWVFFRLTIAGQLLRLFPSTMLFYLLSAAVAAGAALLWYPALFTAHAWLLFPAALGGSALLLIYARLLGRLAWLIHRLNPKREKLVVKEAPDVLAAAHRAKKKRKPQPEPPPPEERRRKSKRLTPWGKEAEEVEGYGLAADASSPPPQDDDKPPRKRKVKTAYGTEIDEVESYGVGAPETPTAPTQEELYAPAEADDEEEEKRDPDDPEPEDEWRKRQTARLYERRKPAPPPAWPFFSGVFSTPWRGNSMRAWVWLSCGGLAVGYGLRMLVMLFPG